MSSGRAITYGVTFLLLATIAWTTAVSVWADPASENTSPGRSLLFRRLYVPKKLMRDVVRNSMPMKPEEFEQHLQALNKSAPHASGARIERAVYAARLEDDQLIEGSLRLEVAKLTEEPARLRLEGSRLALGKPLWDQTPPRQAALATDAQGRQVVLVEESAPLTANWTLRGVRDENGAIRLATRFPPSAINRLILNLPANVAPRVEGGIVQRLQSANQVPQGVRLPRGFGEQDRSDWLIELGGNTSLVLRIVSEGESQTSSPALLRQAATYQIDTQQLHLTTELRLDVTGRPLRQLRLRVDPTIHVTSAHLGDTRLPIADQEATTGESKQLLLTFPQPVFGVDRVIRLTAIAPLHLDEAWKLPRVTSPDALWQEGSATLFVHRPLELNQIHTHLCRQSPPQATPMDDVGETVQWQCHADDASVEVVVGRQASRLSVVSGYAVEFSTAGMTARQQIDFTALAGDSFLLKAELARAWIVDTVETEPSEMLDDWTTSAPRGATRQLLIRLRDAVKAERGVRVVIRAHRRLPRVGVPLNADALRLARFQGVAKERYLTTFLTRPPYQIDIAGDAELSRLDPDNLEKQEADLLTSGEDPQFGNLLFLDNASANQLQLTLNTQAPRYTADIAVALDVRAGSLAERYHIECQPDASQVKRLLVRFSRAGKGSLSWNLVGEGPDAISVRRFDESPQPTAGEVAPIWEITLRRPRSDPFRIEALRRGDFEANHKISLVSLPEASSQSGALTIRTTDENGLSILRDENLRPAPAEPPAPGKIASIRWAFRYDPSQNVQAELAPASKSNRQPAAWIWACDVISRYAETSISHQADFRIENAGRSQVSWRLPEGIRLRRILIDGKEQVLPTIDVQRNFVTALPVDKRHCRVQFICLEPRERFWLNGRVRPQLPTSELPVLRRSWTLWLPVEIAALPPKGSLAWQAGGKADWRRRLLGRLLSSSGRSSHQKIGNLAKSNEAWASEAKQRAEQFLQRLGQNLRDSQSEQEDANRTWRELLNAARLSDNPQDAEPGDQLWIDRRALSETGVVADERVDDIPPSALSDLQRGAALLASKNLILVARKDALLLTSKARWEQAVGKPLVERLQIEASDAIAVSVEEDEPFPQVLESPIRYVPLASWSEKQPWEDVWPANRQRPYAGLADRGWTAYRLEGYPYETLQLRLYRPAIPLAAGWALMLMAASVCWIITKRRPMHLPICVALSAGVALLAPTTIVPITTGLFQGILLGGVLGMFWNLAPSRTISPSPHNTTVLEGPVAATLMLAALLASLGWATASSADENSLTAESRKPQREQIYKVFIPIDEQGNPLDDYLQVEKPLYDALRARVKTAQTRPGGWLIHSTRYQLTLDYSASNTRLDAIELLAQFDLEVMQEEVDVVIPLPRKGFFPLNDRTLLDGERAQVDWNSEGTSFSLTLKGPGRHHLELALQPETQTDRGRGEIDLAIPRVAQSLVQVKSPASIEGIEFTTALGAVQIDKESGLLTADLGPSDRLAVAWPTETARQTDISSRELLWLKARPGSVVLDAQFQFSSTGEPLRELRIAVDPRLKMLPLRADQPVQPDSIEVTEGEIRMRLKQPYQKEVVLNATFLLTGSSGLGNVRLPRLEAHCDHVRRRLLAVSVSPVWEYKTSTGDQPPLETTSIDDFLDLWGPLAEDQQPPQLAFRLPTGKTSWSLATRPIQQNWTARQQLRVSVDSSEAEIEFDALLDSKAGARYGHRLIVPAGIRIDQISLTDQEKQTDHLRRWSRVGSDGVSLFLNQPVAGPQRLSLRGFVSVPPQGIWRLPQITLDETEITSHQVHIFRRGSVQAKLGKVAGMKAVEAGNLPPLFAPADGDNTKDPSNDTTAMLPTLVASLKAVSSEHPPKPETTSIELLLQPNNPRVGGTSVTTLRRIDGSWVADIELNLQITGGVLDTIRLDAPRQWGDTLTVEPAAATRWITLPGQSRRRLIVRSKQPLRGKQIIRLRGSLSVSGARVTAPDIAPLDVPRPNRILVLPTEVEGQQIAWEPRGLQEIRQPLNLSDPPEQPHKVYRIPSRSRFQASIKDVQRISGIAQVRLADIYFSRQVGGGCYGVATFDLEPAGLSECVLTLPESFDLVQATINGLPASLEQAGGSKWRIALGPPDLPQRIGVVYCGVLPPGVPTNRQIAAPRLEEIDVERTLYTVVGPNRAALPAKTGQIDAMRQEMFRQETIVSLVDRASSAALESESREREHWFLPWARHLGQARQAWQSYRTAAGSSLASDDEKWKSLQRQWDDVADMLEVAAINRQAANDANRVVGPTAIWRKLQTAPVVSVLGAGQGPPRPLPILTPSRLDTSDWLARTGLALLIAGLMGLIYVALRRGLLVEPLVQWPHAVGVAIGLAWWMWLSPALPGLVIAGLCLLGSLRHPWREARSRGG